MFSAFYKIISCFAGLGIVFGVAAHSSPYFVTGSFSEKVSAELLVTKMDNTQLQKIAVFTISPDETDFAFAIPQNSSTKYRLQINLMNTAGKRQKLDRICVVPLLLKPDRNYSLTITPSKLDTAKKKGWLLTSDINKSNLAVIRGRLQNISAVEALSLHRVEDGDLVSNNSFGVSSSGEFTIPYPVTKEGFYYLTSSRWRVRVYLRPSDQLQLTIDDQTGLMTSVKGSDINQLLFQWQQLIAPITAYGYNKTEPNTNGLDLAAYFKAYSQLQPTMESFARNLQAADTHQLKAVQTAVQIDRDLAPLYLLSALNAEKDRSPGSAYKDFRDVPAFYSQFIAPDKFNDASIMALGEAKSYMDLYGRLNLSMQSTGKRESMWKGEKLHLMMSSFNNDTLKAFFLKNQLEQQVVNNLYEFRECFEPLQKYTGFAPVKKAYTRLYNSFSADTAFIGKTSYNFTLPDTTGRIFSLRELKGKVVFVDIWASWCGPCKKEFPFLKELEEEYHDNKELVFVGISIDRLEDKQKWLQAIRKEKLAGVQLLDDAGQSFAHKYGVSSIPRFMLIDKEGKWIEVRCPRPSAKEELKRYLDNALGQKMADSGKHSEGISTN